MPFTLETDNRNVDIKKEKENNGRTCKSEGCDAILERPQDFSFRYIPTGLDIHALSLCCAATIMQEPYPDLTKQKKEIEQGRVTSLDLSTALLFSLFGLINHAMQGSL